MKNKFTAFVILILLALTSNIRADSNSDFFTKKFYDFLKPVIYFDSVTPSLDSNTKDLGIDFDRLKNYTSLKVLNSFTGATIHQAPRLSNGDLDSPAFDRREYASIRVSIRTVGTTYPIAYYIKITIQPWGADWRLYEDDVLGYCSNKDLVNGKILEENISKLIENAAITFLKVKDKI